MAKAAKPRATAKAKAKARPEFTDREQSERFIEAARKLGVESTVDFDATAQRILAKRP